MNGAIGCRHRRLRIRRDINGQQRDDGGHQRKPREPEAGLFESFHESPMVDERVQNAQGPPPTVHVVSAREQGHQEAPNESSSAEKIGQRVWVTRLLRTPFPDTSGNAPSIQLALRKYDGLPRHTMKLSRSLKPPHRLLATPSAPARARGVLLLRHHHRWRRGRELRRRPDATLPMSCQTPLEPYLLHWR